ncbi:MAG: hypothetical protein JJU46_11660 [Balneolaceae bacterium]|nr:hypothetical protein [Balneolaceae bacterium]MCH8548360.1 hypothetical protein [Balneolaceae bacterium]
MLKHLFLIIVLFGCYLVWDMRPVTHGEGVIAPDAPNLVQTNRHPGFHHEEFILKPKWKIEATNRVLSSRTYWLDDKRTLSPRDFVFGWGDLSDERILGQVSTSIRSRDYSLEVIRPPMTIGEIRNHLLFAHTIPANEEVRKTIRDIRPGHLVSFRGYLVDIDQDSNPYWLSTYSGSRSRLDGSQIVYIEHIEIQ